MVVSIIIPTYNRAKDLNAALLSIQNNLISSADYEVIVVDNGSTDNTREICNAYTEAIPNFKYFYDSEPGLLTGRHLGVEKATGTVLCFLDDDVELNPLYIYNLIAAFEDKKINLATGPCLPKYEVYPPSWLNHLWTTTTGFGKWCGSLSLLDFGDEIKMIDPNFVWGLNFNIRKEALIELGGFHPDIAKNSALQGDGETGLTLKAIDKGYQAIYHPGLLLYHNVSKERLTKEYFQKRAYFQGVSNSFTDLRRKYFSHQELPVTSNKKLRDKLHPYYRWIKNIYPNKKSTEIPNEVIELTEKLASSELEGYQFHQQSFNTNAVIKEWVLRNNYWNYKNPEND